ncbi:hypothetical protein ACRAWF_16850 [Streptomyces sp. L7]
MPDQEDHTADGGGAVTPLYGEPFDSGLARAKGHHLNAEGRRRGRRVRGVAHAGRVPWRTPPTYGSCARTCWRTSRGVQLAATDLVAAQAAVDRSNALLDGISSAPMGPRGRQLWLELVLRTLIARADLLRRTGHLDEALACLDEAALRLPEFDDPDGLRTAELGLNRVHLLMDRGAWGAAEEQASALLSTTPDTAVETVPRLLVALGLICSSTGRFDAAEDHFARAEEHFRLSGDTGEQQNNAGAPGVRRAAPGRTSTWRSGCSRRRPSSSNGRGGSATSRSANRRVPSSPAGGATTPARRARWRRAWSGSNGSVPSIAAADSLLLGAQHAYARGDIDEMKRLAQEARDVYQEREVYERCAQVDLMLARTLEDNLNRTDHGDRERESIDNALSFALPAALALEAAALRLRHRPRAQ